MMKMEQPLGCSFFRDFRRLVPQRSIGCVQARGECIGAKNPLVAYDKCKMQIHPRGLGRPFWRHIQNVPVSLQHAAARFGLWRVALMTPATQRKTCACKSRMCLTFVILGLKPFEKMDTLTILWVTMATYENGALLHGPPPTKVKYKQPWWVLPNDGLPRIKGRNLSQTPNRTEHTLEMPRLHAYPRWSRYLRRKLNHVHRVHPS